MNIFDFSIWAIFVAIGLKKTLKIQKKKQIRVKNATGIIKAQNAQKSKKKKKSQILKKRLVGSYLFH